MVMVKVVVQVKVAVAMMLMAMMLMAMMLVTMMMMTLALVIVQWRDRRWLGLKQLLRAPKPLRPQKSPSEVFKGQAFLFT